MADISLGFGTVAACQLFHAESTRPHYRRGSISATTTVGRTGSVRRSAASIWARSRPLMVLAAQPKAANLKARSPRSLVLEWLLMAMQVRLPRPWLVA